MDSECDYFIFYANMIYGQILLHAVQWATLVYNILMHIFHVSLGIVRKWFGEKVDGLYTFD
jgi:hypothetical protein